MTSMLTPLPAFADAASCLNQCGNRCYTSPNPASCSQACTSACIAQGNQGPKPYCGSVMVGTHYEEAMGWSWGAEDTATANRAAWDKCRGPKAPECTQLIEFCNECVAVARPRDAKGKLIGSIAGRGPDIATAERDVAEKCHRHTPDAASCKIEKRLCADRGPL
jgi:hypothetical protein